VRRHTRYLVALCGLVIGAGGLLAAGAQRADEEQDRPKLSLRARPTMGFSPINVTLTAELRGGPDDFEEFYCPEIEWDWDDGTTSEASADCDPYEAGVTRIRRRYTASHRYHESGAYQIRITLKRRDDTLAAASTTVQVRPGMRER